MKDWTLQKKTRDTLVPSKRLQMLVRLGMFVVVQTAKRPIQRATKETLSMHLGEYLYPLSLEDFILLLSPGMNVQGLPSRTGAPKLG